MYILPQTARKKIFSKNNLQVNWLKVITRLAAKINEKGTESYADAISYIRTKISFALLRSSVLCLRGCRATRRQQAIVESSISAIVHEGGLS